MYSVNDTLQAGWVFPFGDPRIKARLSAPRGISQISTSFIAYYRLGIHRMRLFTWPYNPKQPFWLDLFALLFVTTFTRRGHVVEPRSLARSSCASISTKISAPNFNYLKNDSDWSIVNAPFEKTLTTEYLPNNNQTTKTIIADTPYADCQL